MRTGIHLAILASLLILPRSAITAAPASPTVSSDVPPGLTEDDQPVVELNVKVQNPAG